MCRVNLEKDVTKRNRLITELDEDGRKKSGGILFFGVLEIKKEIGKVCCPGIGDAFDVLDDGGASDT